MIASKHPAPRDFSPQARPGCGDPLVLSCSRCLGGLSVDGSLLGQEVECPHCRGSIRVLSAAPVGATRAGPDPPGTIGLALGCLALLCLLIALRSGGLAIFAAALLAPTGLVIGFFGRGGSRAAGLTVGLLTTGPALALFFSALGEAAAKVFG